MVSRLILSYSLKLEFGNVILGLCVNCHQPLGPYGVLRTLFWQSVHLDGLEYFHV